MKNLLAIPLICVLFPSCSKSDDNSPPPDPNITVVKNKIRGAWFVDSLQERSIVKCKKVNCTILNPDGSIKDSTRKTYNYTINKLLWNFQDDNILTIMDNNGEVKSGWEMYNKDSVSMPPHNDLKIMDISDIHVLLVEQKQSAVFDDHYTAFTYYYYLTRRQ